METPHTLCQGKKKKKETCQTTSSNESQTDLKNLHENKHIRIFQIDRVALGHALCDMLNEHWSRYGRVISHSQLNLVLSISTVSTFSA
jgi:hypothetical protein